MNGRQRNGLASAKPLETEKASSPTPTMDHDETPQLRGGHIIRPSQFLALLPELRDMVCRSLLASEGTLLLGIPMAAEVPERGTRSRSPLTIVDLTLQQQIHSLPLLVVCRTTRAEFLSFMVLQLKLFIVCPRKISL